MEKESKDCSNLIYYIKTIDLISFYLYGKIVHNKLKITFKKKSNV